MSNQILEEYFSKDKLNYRFCRISIGSCDFSLNSYSYSYENEPNAKQIWESCLYSSSEEADLLKNYLYPIFRKNGLNIQFLIWDHNKDIWNP